MRKIPAVIIAKINKHCDRLSKNGFTMLDAMMTVGLILGLAVGGYLAYSKVVANTSQASVESAAVSVYTAALAAEMDGNSETTFAGVQSDFNNSQDTIEVTITITDTE